MNKTGFKSFIIYLLKFVSAGIVAVIILSILMCFYSVTPVHMDNPKGNTDYVWIPNSFWVNTTEGISFGKLDSDGFNNKSVIEQPDILLVGSSHIEAKNVMPKRSFLSVLQNEIGEKYSVYNVGMSGHNFVKSCQYLPDNLKLYKNLKYIIIETADLTVTRENVDNVLNHTVEVTPSYANGLIGKLQRIPFVYNVYRQLDNGLLDLFMDKKASAQKQSNDIVLDEKAYEDIFKFLSDIEKESKAEIIIFYHPFEDFDESGNILFKHDEFTQAFKEKAAKYSIDYIDLADSFTEGYNTENKVPHGFVTGKIASGHLNNFGHRIAAGKVYEIIKEKESIN